MKIKDLIVKEPLLFRIQQRAVRAICVVTRRHKPKQKMYDTFCARCYKVLPDKE